MKKHKGGQKQFLLERTAAEYCAIHRWIKKRYKKPKLCQYCKSVNPYDLANISGKYKKDVTDWEYLCRKCHMKKDGRLEVILQRNKLGLPIEEIISYRGKKHYDASIELGGDRNLVYIRVRKLGWSLKKAFTTPKGTIRHEYGKIYRRSGHIISEAEIKSK